MKMVFNKEHPDALALLQYNEVQIFLKCLGAVVIVLAFTFITLLYKLCEKIVSKQILILKV
jgi:hypothetical protein